MTTAAAIDAEENEGRYAPLGDYIVNFEIFKQDADPGQYFVGLPNDRCQGLLPTGIRRVLRPDGVLSWANQPGAESPRSADISPLDSAALLRSVTEVVRQLVPGAHLVLDLRVVGGTRGSRPASSGSGTTPRSAGCGG
jgi:hypothetical protein